jgi:hypothetical protein
MLIMLAESRHRRCKLSRHPANAGFKVWLLSPMIIERFAPLKGAQVGVWDALGLTGAICPRVRGFPVAIKLSSRELRGGSRSLQNDHNLLKHIVRFLPQFAK